MSNYRVCFFCFMLNINSTWLILAVRLFSCGPRCYLMSSKSIIEVEGEVITFQET